MSNYDELTDQQLEIVKNDDKFIMINAGAGTGKTSTLVSYTQKRPDKRFLYLSFNRLLTENAMVKFGFNVKSYTIHALAFNFIGYEYLQKEKISFNELKVLDILEPLGLSSYEEGRIILDIFNNFLQSIDKEINKNHYPKFYHFINKKDKKKIIELPKRLDLIDKAKELWQKMQDLDNKSVLMTNNGYLKLFFLLHPDLSKYFDTILFDEVQDIDPIMHEFIMEQSKKCQIIMVGDRFQSIYGFRGAINSIERIQESNNTNITYLNLTNSFRFGDRIANIANLLLQDFLDTSFNLRGNSKIDSQLDIDFSKPFTVISRTNAGCFEVAYQLLSTNISFSFLNGIDEVQKQKLIDVYYLLKEQPFYVKDKSLKYFQSSQEFKKYLEESKDIELNTILKINEKFLQREKQTGHSILYYLNKITAQNREDNQAHVLISTVHKCKGLQFKQVYLNNDFPVLYNNTTNNLNKFLTNQEKEEIHLLYVAVTRAILGLSCNNVINRWLYMRPIHIEIFLQVNIDKELQIGNWSYILKYNQEDSYFNKLNNEPIEIKGCLFENISIENLYYTAILEALNFIKEFMDNKYKISIYFQHKKIFNKFKTWKNQKIQYNFLTNDENQIILNQNKKNIIKNIQNILNSDNNDNIENNNLWNKLNNLLEEFLNENHNFNFNLYKLNKTENENNINYKYTFN